MELAKTQTTEEKVKSATAALDMTFWELGRQKHEMDKCADRISELNVKANNQMIDFNKINETWKKEKSEETSIVGEART